jgi:hypothetical protein
MPQPPHCRRASSWLLEAENNMVSTLFRPEPTTWLPAQDQPVQPAAAGGYITPSGEELFSARGILDRVYPHTALQLARNPVVLRACVAYANSLHNPDVSAAGPWLPAVAPFTDQLSTIAPLIGHPFWANLKVLAAPIHVRHRRLPLGATAELLVRFSNGGDIGIGLCQSAASDQLDPIRVAAEVGAAIALLGDSCSWWPRRAFVLFCSERTTVEMIDVDKALCCWIDAIDAYRFMAKTLNWRVRL